MKLLTKFAWFITLSKLFVFALFVLSLPFIIERLAYAHTDYKLHLTKQKVAHQIKRTGIESLMAGNQSITVGSYDRLRDEYVFLEPYVGQDTTARLKFSQQSREDKIEDYRVLRYFTQMNGKGYVVEIGKSLNTVQELMATLRKLALYLLSLVVFTTLVIDLGFARYVLQPLNTIVQQKLRNVQHPTHFNFTPIKTSTTDFQVLDESINEMMRQVGDAFRREKEFAANASHELTTPIAILQNRFENLIADPQTPPTLAVKLVESQQTLQRLNAIVESLLHLTRIENNQYLKEDTVSIRALLLEVIGAIEDRALYRGIRLSVVYGEDLLFRSCNQSLLFTMLFNLLSNAVRYNVPHGEIRLRQSTDGLACRVEIEDTGVGIAPQEIPTLFDSFRKTRGADSESHGIGLRLVKTIADFHGIGLRVSSKINHGTIFELTFVNQPSRD